ncbi:MAG: hypothetical protein H6R25_6 [Proteobacteria bacterium]|nr:hypothetical protein [Pseudomonadota bacterium]
MRAFHARLQEQRTEQALTPLPELTQMLTSQLGLLCQATCKQANSDTLAARVL